MLRKNSSGWIYFLANKKLTLVKIGFSTDVKKRVIGLATSSPEPLILLATAPALRRHERTLHLKFRRWRKRGEWFALSRQIAHHILTHTPRPGAPSGDHINLEPLLKKPLTPDELAVLAHEQDPSQDDEHDDDNLNMEALTVDQLARLMQIHPWTLRRLARHKRIPHMRIGTVLRFNYDDVLAVVRRDAVAKDATAPKRRAHHRSDSSPSNDQALHRNQNEVTALRERTESDAQEQDAAPSTDTREAGSLTVSR